MVERVQAFSGFGGSGNMADGNPPEDQGGGVHWFEPFFAVAQGADVVALVVVVLQGLDMVELVDEAGHDGIVEGGAHAGDIELGEVVGHGRTCR